MLSSGYLRCNRLLVINILLLKSVLMPSTILKQNILSAYFRFLCLPAFELIAAICHLCCFLPESHVLIRSLLLSPQGLDGIALLYGRGKVVLCQSGWRNCWEWEDLRHSASLAAARADCCFLPGRGKSMSHFANRNGHGWKEIYLDGKSMF